MIKETILKLKNKFFPCKHKTLTLYTPSTDKGNIPFDPSIPQIVNPRMPTHQCRQCQTPILIKTYRFTTTCSIPIRTPGEIRVQNRDISNSDFTVNITEGSEFHMLRPSLQKKSVGVMVNVRVLGETDSDNVVLALFSNRQEYTRLVAYLKVQKNHVKSNPFEFTYTFYVGKNKEGKLPKHLSLRIGGDHGKTVCIEDYEVTTLPVPFNFSEQKQANKK